MEDDEPSDDCKYKLICNFYKPHCYEPSCWRAKFLKGMIKENVLEKILIIDENVLVKNTS